jgi:hypothetical protein
VLSGKLATGLFTSFQLNEAAEAYVLPHITNDKTPLPPQRNEKPSSLGLQPSLFTIEFCHTLAEKAAGFIQASIVIAESGITELAVPKFTLEELPLNRMDELLGSHNCANSFELNTTAKSKVIFFIYFSFYLLQILNFKSERQVK